MVAFILPANSATGGYEISNSLRFGGGNSYLSREFSGDPTGARKKFTLSCWLKRSELGERAIIGASTSNNFYDNITFSSGDQLDINNVASGSDAISFKTNMKFRDVSAWYHIVFGIDTTQASGSNGIKIYINGVLQTSLATSNYTQNATFEIGRDGSTTSIGRRQRDEDYYNVGYLSDFYFIDGQQLAASDFGETNDNGVWIPKKYDGTYGNNGFLLEFKSSGTSQNSSGMGADTSGNDEHFAATNLAATDVTTDTPTNNFATMNPLAIGADATLSEGNCQIAYGSGTRSVSTANMGFASGKWYWEWKISAASTDGCSAMLGIGALPFGPDLGTYLGQNSNGYSYNGEDGQKFSGGANSSYGNNFTTNDIISVAFDADNGNLYFYKNGTIQNSGTAAYTGLTSPSSGFHYPAIGDASGTKTFTAQANFGNPPFSISSSNADADGHGNFEYAVPSGYFALCTKNLAEYG